MHRIIDAHLDLAWNALSFNRDQTDTMQHADRVVPAQTNHVRHCHLPGTGTVPARTSRRPTSGCQPAANARC